MNTLELYEYIEKNGDIIITLFRPVFGYKHHLITRDFEIEYLKNKKRIKGNNIFSFTANRFLKLKGKDVKSVKPLSKVLGN